MSTSLNVAIAAGAAAAEVAEDAAEVADALEAEADSWRALSLAGAAATRGARTKRPLRMVDTLGILRNYVVVIVEGDRFVRIDGQQSLALNSNIKCISQKSSQGRVEEDRKECRKLLGTEIWKPCS
jgi:hypothetical protein